MNMPFPSRKQVESIRKNYPPGTRVMLNNMNDPYSPVEPGTRGTVRYVDDSGQLGVAWDNGRSLSLIPGEDSFRKLTQQEIIQEQGSGKAGSTISGCSGWWCPGTPAATRRNGWMASMRFSPRKAFSKRALASKKPIPSGMTA